MDTGKQTIEASRRAAKSKQVSLKWCSTANIVKDGLFSNKMYFKILDGKKVKYHVKIDSNGIFSACSCPSFKFGMAYMKKPQCFASIYFSEHGHTFNCKHIIACIGWTKGQ